MTDITKQPYSKWLEETLQELADLNPASIGIACIMPDGTNGTAYFNTGNGERAGMIRAMSEDFILDFVRVNADIIADILNESGDDQWEN